MKSYLLPIALLVICLLPTQTQLSTEFTFEEEQLIANEESPITATENLEEVIETTFDTSTPLIPDLAIPIPVNLTIPGDQAAANLRNSAARLNQAGGRVAIRNDDGTASIVNANDLANTLLVQAGPIGDLGSDIKIEIPNGGKVPFIYIGPSEKNLTQDTNSTNITTVMPTFAPVVPELYLISASFASSYSNSAAYNLDAIYGYVVTTTSNGTIRVVNASVLAQEARNQAEALSGVSDYNVLVSNNGDFDFQLVDQIGGFSPIYGIILIYDGRVGVVSRQETGSTPTLTLVDSTPMPPYQSESRVPADVAASNLRNSASNLTDIGGYVATRDSNGEVTVLEARKLASYLNSQADIYSKLGTIPVITFDEGKVQFEPVIRVEGIPPIDAFILNSETKSVTLVQFRS